MRLPFVVAVLCSLLVILYQRQCDAAKGVTRRLSPFLLVGREEILPGSIPLFLQIRGGATRSSDAPSKKGKKKTKNASRTASLSSISSSKTATGKKSVGARQEEKADAGTSSSIKKAYKSIPLLTKIFITSVAVVTLVGYLLGEEAAQALLALDPIRLFYGFEIWRVFTAACFLGPPSLSWVLDGYHILTFGSSLERAYGTAQHFVFLLSQLVLLTTTCAILRQPFYAQSMVTAMLHVLSRATPHQKVKWLVITVPHWFLPVGWTIASVLQAQSPMAGIPHVLGILSGHFYHFHRYVWPKLGGVDWLVAPAFLSRLLDPNSVQSSNDAKETVNKALRKRSRKKGRKLSKK